MNNPKPSVKPNNSEIKAIPVGLPETRITVRQGDPPLTSGRALVNPVTTPGCNDPANPHNTPQMITDMMRIRLADPHWYPGSYGSDRRSLNRKPNVF